MPITLGDVARRCKVSKSTVSLVLNNPDHPGFKAATRTQVLEAARDLHYMPNLLAHGLRRGRTRLLSLVYPYNDPELIDQAQSTAEQLGYAMMVQFMPTPDFEAERRAVLAALARQVDGLIWKPVGEPARYSKLAEIIRRSDTKVVLLEDALPNLPAAGVVSLDMADGFKQAVTHFKSHGYRKLIHVSSRETERYRPHSDEFLRRCQAAGMRADILHIETRSLSVEHLRPLMKSAAQPWGFLCRGNWFALDLLKIARLEGWQVPDHIGIAAYFDMLLGNRIRVGEISSPTITALRREKVTTALAVNMMAASLEDDDAGTLRCVEVPLGLVARESTAR